MEAQMMQSTGEKIQAQHQAGPQGTKLPFWETPFGNFVKAVGKGITCTWAYVFTFKWAEGLLGWLTLSAGTLSGLAFFLAGLWFMIDASVHPFIQAIVSGKLADLIASGHLDVVLSYLATAAFTGLPEFLLPLATYKTFNHFKTWRYTKEKEPMIWFFLFGTPGVLFLLVTVITMGFSMATVGMASLDPATLNVATLEKVQFVLPVWITVPRGVVAFFYGFFALIYPQIGKPSEADRLKKRDDALTEMKTKNEKALTDLRDEKDKALFDLRIEKQKALSDLQVNKDKEITELRADYAQSLQVIEELQSQVNMQASRVNALEHSINKNSGEALQAYGPDTANWLNSESKSFLISEITRYTGHSWQKIRAALRAKILKAPGGKGEDRVTKESLIPWLIANVPERDTQDIPVIYSVK